MLVSYPDVYSPQAQLRSDSYAGQRGHGHGRHGVSIGLGTRLAFWFPFPLSVSVFRFRFRCRHFREVHLPHFNDSPTGLTSTTLYNRAHFNQITPQLTTSPKAFDFRERSKWRVFKLLQAGFRGKMGSKKIGDPDPHIPVKMRNRIPASREIRTPGSPFPSLQASSVNLRSLKISYSNLSLG